MRELDVAIESAGIVSCAIVTPRDVVGAIELSRATYRKMIQNLVWATAYNLVAIPVAGGLFVHWGLDLPMSVGAVAMSLSTIIGCKRATAPSTEASAHSSKKLNRAISSISFHHGDLVISHLEVSQP